MAREHVPAGLFLVKATPENKDALVELTMRTRCAYCERVYTTLEDLKGTVWYGPHDHGRLACQSCWDKANGEKL